MELGTSLIKLQEHLLNKGDQNKIASAKLGRILIALKLIQYKTGSKLYQNVIDWIENQQMVTGGRSRDEYMEVLKDMKPLPESNTFGGDKK